ncbi:MAG TPA: hypothetical protein VFS30_11440 [Dehalococcoidia bacterium]|nr:hypothetical protein [Dehalococcoidia bacterium]
MIRLATVVASLYAAIYYLGRTWGSRPEERGRRLSGDEIVPSAKLVTDHAITIDAPPERVWPWLLQVGWGRAGWYTYRWVDRLLFPNNAPSARRILPQFQSLEAGDEVPDGPPESGCFFVVERMEADRLLVLHSTTHLPAKLLRDPRVALSWTWTFTLDPEPGGRTRYHFRVRLNVRPLWLLVASHLFIVPADFLMARSMCKGLKERVESMAIES